MDRRKLFSSFSVNEEQQMLFSHILDCAERSKNRNLLISTDFISQNDAVILDRIFQYAGLDQYLFCGGYPEAERTVTVFLPDYYTMEDVLSEPSLAELVYLTATLPPYHRQKAEISHRDVLGSLLSLGIERSKVGDIQITDEGAVVVVKEGIVSFLLDEWKRIGRYDVSVQRHDHYSISPNVDYIEERDTVASMRLDAVVASLYHVSRTVASEAISAGLVAVNGVLIQKPDHLLSPADKLTYRGKGRIRLLNTSGQSKKGRIVLSFLRYR